MSDLLTIQQSVGDIVFDVTIEEQHTDKLAVTRHPVELGAQITDHSYKEPAELTIHAGSSNSSWQADGDPDYVNRVYEALLDLQAGRQRFNVVTTKRLYQNMLMTSLGVTTDEETSQVLMVSATFTEIIIVETQITNIASNDNHADPSQTGSTASGGTVSLVPAPNANVAAFPAGVGS